MWIEESQESRLHSIAPTKTLLKLHSENYEFSKFRQGLLNRPLALVISCPQLKIHSNISTHTPNRPIKMSFKQQVTYILVAVSAVSCKFLLRFLPSYIRLSLTLWWPSYQWGEYITYEHPPNRGMVHGQVLYLLVLSLSEYVIWALSHISSCQMTFWQVQVAHFGIAYFALVIFD